MANQALGTIETISLAAGVAAADAACKAANVELVGYQLSKGGGMVTVKICGDVSDVNAAIAAAKEVAAQVCGVYATNVIARPHESIEHLVRNNQTVGFSSTQA